MVGDPFPSVTSELIGFVVVGLKTFAGGEFDVGDEEVEFESLFVGVLDPADVVLLSIKSCKQHAFKAIHDLLFVLGTEVGFLKAQAAGGVFFGVVAAVGKGCADVWITR